MYTIHCTVHNVHCTLYSLQCTYRHTNFIPSLCNTEYGRIRNIILLMLFILISDPNNHRGTVTTSGNSSEIDPIKW